MITMVSYFVIIAHKHSCEQTIAAEQAKMEAVLKTYALHLEQVYHDAVVSQKQLSAESIREIAKTSLLEVNRLNNLSEGVSILIVDNHLGSVHTFNQDTSTELGELNSTLKELVRKKPLVPSSGASENEDLLFYAYPLSLSNNGDFYASLYLEENISPQIAKAESILWRQISLSVLCVVLLSLLSYRYLRKILLHEVAAKRRLRELVNEAEAKNKELETLSFVLRKSDHLIILCDPGGKIEWVNTHHEEKNNYSESELDHFIGKELAEVSHYPKIQEILNEVLETRKKKTYEVKTFDANKKPFWASTTVTPILNEEGEVERLLFIDADITQTKNTEAALESMAKFAQESTKPLIRLKRDGTILFANDAGKRILRIWETGHKGKISRKNILVALEKCFRNQTDEQLNLEFENRIFNFTFSHIKGTDYAHIHGEDITEIKHAERASRDRFNEIEQYNLNITDSINYARKIQQAILPDEDNIRKYFNDSFILNKPKDIVSGDFYWMHELRQGKEYLVALADCTGHGVPGAMMSIVGHSLLNEIVETHREFDPATILSELNKQIIKSLRQKNKSKSSDGMDVSLVRIDLERYEITFAGAYQHLYWVNGKLNVLKGDRQPVGGLHHDNHRQFSNTTVKITRGDCIYLTSDGFTDQFGGELNKKFLSKRLQTLIKENHKYSMQAQSHIFNKAFEDWKGENEQIDDVSMIGIKF
jgi:PAS domain S-box-containing protein